METLRGLLGDFMDASAYDADEEEFVPEAPPPVIGQDERRMQVRAYNHWASLLGDRRFPLIEDLRTGELPDFDPYAVVLDFADGVENPLVRYIGDALAAESDCDPTGVRTLEDVPGRSLLSRITDHYLQIVANEAPIGFEAEFVNQRGRTILYRGILLPFSANADSDMIDQIYGVINWKELADQQTTAALLQEIDRALQIPTPAAKRPHLPLQEWADGPADHDGADTGDVLELALEAQDFSDGGEIGLYDLLASARELALAAQGAEERSHAALYAAIGRAHDFALLAEDYPEDLAELMEDSGLKMQQRAPLIPLLKLVFGTGYDKTRLTEYATVLGHARRIGVAPGRLAAYLGAEPGGLKGVIQRERQLRREESGRSAAASARPSPRKAVAQRLRALPARPLNAVPTTGSEFAVLLARRTEDGEIVLLGEVDDDVALIERAARHITG